MKHSDTVLFSAIGPILRFMQFYGEVPWNKN